MFTESGVCALLAVVFVSSAHFALFMCGEDTKKGWICCFNLFPLLLFYVTIGADCRKVSVHDSGGTISLYPIGDVRGWQHIDYRR